MTHLTQQQRVLEILQEGEWIENFKDVVIGQDYNKQTKKIIPLIVTVEEELEAIMSGGVMWQP